MDFPTKANKVTKPLAQITVRPHVSYASLYVTLRQLKWAISSYAVSGRLPAPIYLTAKVTSKINIL